MIKPETIQSILETSRIEEVIGDFVTLKKRGANYLGLCPFHNEKTPSFSVSPSKGIYKCFGCGKAGNVVNFVIEHEHYSYPEALKYLAKKYGIEVEEEELTPEMQQEFDVRESMFAANTFISKHFEGNLFNSQEGKSIGLTYFKERDFLESTIKLFQLGYAIDNWESYSNHAAENGYKKDVLVKTGLSIEKDDRLIDRFKGRVIFPIHNLTGKVIGFGGRILSAKKSTAKYINSPESEVYNKSKALYGIFFARNAIVRQNNCYLVEGYTDVISMYQAGIENVVSSSGTSLTVDQIRLIKRFTPNITILYDGDPAGIKASFRGIDLILEQGMNVKIVLFPEGEDPDSYVRNHRTSHVEEFISKGAVDFIKFKTGLLLDETVGDPAGRASLIKEIVNTIAQIPDGINRTVYIKECSVVMDIPEQTLMNELNKSLRRKFSKSNAPPIEDIPIPDERKLQDQQLEIDPLTVAEFEKSIIELILTNGYDLITVESDDGKETKESIVDFIIHDFQNDHIKFENEIYNEILEEYKRAIEGNIKLELDHFVNHQKKSIANEVIEISSSKEYLANWKSKNIWVKKGKDNIEDYFDSLIFPFKARLIAKMLKDISIKIKYSEDYAEKVLLMQEYNTIKAIQRKIDKTRKREFNY